ncbi:MAG: hypothetical protein ACOYMG_24690, partial [Candidatus Methylumidiphilus sp.]
EEAADWLIAPVEQTIRQRLGTLIFGSDADTLESVMLADLNQRGETLSVVEYGTGGRLAGKLSQVMGFGKSAFAAGNLLGSQDEVDLIELAHRAANQSHANWGLACVVEGGDGAMQLGVGIWHENYCQQRRRGFGGHAALAPEWSSNVAMDGLRKLLAAAKPK